VIDLGTLVEVDLGGERPRRALVLSNRRFTNATERVLVAPEWSGPLDGPIAPWHVRVGDGIYAVDRLISVATERVLDRLGEAPFPSMVEARHTLMTITA
jgi:mRNA-degrading endonuclease toxin of MazEF toxin-antitoxin module